mmetsp:Transcript_28058/g.43651  ORF Transcript_28058/g.43651 Transcript_28058/m.43651 type:complete len:137 (-) Transcript_28058:191-601(-)
MHQQSTLFYVCGTFLLRRVVVLSVSLVMIDKSTGVRLERVVAGVDGTQQMEPVSDDTSTFDWKPRRATASLLFKTSQSSFCTSDNWRKVATARAPEHPAKAQLSGIYLVEITPIATATLTMTRSIVIKEQIESFGM